MWLYVSVRFVESNICLCSISLTPWRRFHDVDYYRTSLVRFSIRIALSGDGRPSMRFPRQRVAETQAVLSSIGRYYPLWWFSPERRRRGCRKDSREEKRQLCRGFLEVSRNRSWKWKDSGGTALYHFAKELEVGSTWGCGQEDSHRKDIPHRGGRLVHRLWWKISLRLQKAGQKFQVTQFRMQPKIGIRPQFGFVGNSRWPKGGTRRTRTKSICLRPFFRPSLLRDFLPAEWRGEPPWRYSYCRILCLFLFVKLILETVVRNVHLSFFLATEFEQ